MNSKPLPLYPALVPLSIIVVACKQLCCYDFYSQPHHKVYLLNTIPLLAFLWQLISGHTHIIQAPPTTSHSSTPLRWFPLLTVHYSNSHLLPSVAAPRVWTVSNLRNLLKNSRNSPQDQAPMPIPIPARMSGVPDAVGWPVHQSLNPAERQVPSTSLSCLRAAFSHCLAIPTHPGHLH